MTLSAQQIAETQLAAYSYDGTPFTWNWLCDQTQFKSTYAGLKVIDDTQLIVMPGTGGGVNADETMRQWQLNFSAFPEVTPHLQFGWIENGFYSEMEDFTAALCAWLDPTKPIAGVGHSRGAAQIQIVAGLLKLRNLHLKQLHAFAPPRVGGSEFVAFIADVPKVLYRTVGEVAPDHDLVTDVPLWPAEHAASLTDLPVSPLPNDQWLMFKYHHMQLYAGALHA